MASINNILQKNILCVPERLDCSDATHSILFPHCNPSHCFLEYYNISVGMAYFGWWFCHLNNRTGISYAGYTICMACFIFRSNARKSDPPFLKEFPDLLLCINTFMDMDCNLLSDSHNFHTKGEDQYQASSCDNCSPGDIKYFCAFRFFWTKTGLS